jgi:hypothetical protein
MTAPPSKLNQELHPMKWRATNCWSLLQHIPSYPLRNMVKPRIRVALTAQKQQPLTNSNALKFINAQILPLYTCQGKEILIDRLMMSGLSRLTTSRARMSQWWGRSLQVWS